MENTQAPHCSHFENVKVYRPAVSLIENGHVVSLQSSSVIVDQIKKQSILCCGATSDDRLHYFVVMPFIRIRGVFTKYGTKMQSGSAVI